MVWYDKTLAIKSFVKGLKLKIPAILKNYFVTLNYLFIFRGILFV